jgi:hypothetical protein
LKDVQGGVPSLNAGCPFYETPLGVCGHGHRNDDDVGRDRSDRRNANLNTQCFPRRRQSA